MTKLLKILHTLIHKIPVLRETVDLMVMIQKRVATENLSFFAGGVAFYALLSVFPAMTALVSLYGLVADVSDVEKQLSYVQSMFPVEAYKILETQLNAIISHSDANLSIAVLVGLAVTFLSAARGIKAMLAAMNLIYGVTETRKWLKRNALAYVFTVGAIACMAVGIFAIVAVPILINVLHLPEIIANQVAHVRWLILGGGVWVGLAILFRYGPNRVPRRWFSMFVGSAVATVLWVLVSAGFSKFVEIFPSFNEIYGSLSAVVVLMFWFFLSAYAVLIGGAVNVALEDYFDI